MKRLLVLVVIVFAAAAVLPAVTIPDCGALTVGSPNTGTVSQLVALGTTGCQSQDKIFSNFVYSGTVTADNINFNLVLQTGASDIHGWSFVPETAWVGTFSLSYDIAVAAGNPLVAIVLSKDQMNSGGVPNGISIADTQTVGVGTLALTGTLGGETVFSNPYNLQMVHTSSVATIPTGRNLLSYEQDFFEVTASTVPEPVSFLLIGSGLLGLGLLRRRKS